MITVRNAGPNMINQITHFQFSAINQSIMNGKSWNKEVDRALSRNSPLVKGFGQNIMLVRDLIDNAKTLGQNLC